MMDNCYYHLTMDRVLVLRQEGERLNAHAECPTFIQNEIGLIS
jgi:hypothetical protein